MDESQPFIQFSVKSLSSSIEEEEDNIALVIVYLVN